MAGSQLTQLKSALTNAGLGRKSFSKKEKKAFKKGGARESDRAKTLQKLEDIKRGLNKFDHTETKVRDEDWLRVYLLTFSSNMMSVEDSLKELLEILVWPNRLDWKNVKPNYLPNINPGIIGVLSRIDDLEKPTRI